MLVDFKESDISNVVLPRTAVIGSGPVGLAVATGLRRRGIPVVVLEGGPWTATAISDLNDGDVIGLPFTGMHKRGRGLGGGTSQWAGQCLRFHAADFQRRHWVDGSGWPISYDDLLPYYSEAEQFFDVTADGYLARLWRDFGLEPGAMVDADVFVRFSAFAREPRVFNRDRRRWKRDTDCWLIYNATVTGFHRTGDQVASLTICDGTGKTHTLPVRTVVLCAGGIENARILLEPTADFPSGLGGGNKHVGKHLQDHPHLIVGKVTEYARGQGLSDVTRYLSTLYRKRRRYLPRLVLSAARQQELGVLNACGIALFEWPAESMTQNLRELQAAISGQRFDLSFGSRAIRTLRDPLALSRTVQARLRGASSGEIPSGINLEGYVEQDPTTSSSVTLSSRRDSFGRPFAAVSWLVGEFERRTLESLAQEVDSYLRRNEIGRVVISESLRAPGDAWKSAIRDNQHHVGTARMAPSERNGVVDPDGKVHGLQNVYLSGGAVMPTGSHANPTLTMTALGFRLAAHLARTGRAPV